MEKATRKQKINFFEELIRIKNHFFKDINSKLKNVTAIESINQMATEFNTENCINNVAKALGYDELRELPYHDTINTFLKKPNPVEIEKIRKYMIVDPIFKLCKQNNWKYIFTFKKGRTKIVKISFFQLWMKTLIQDILYSID